MHFARCFKKTKFASDTKVKCYLMDINTTYAQCTYWWIALDEHFTLHWMNKWIFERFRIMVLKRSFRYLVLWMWNRIKSKSQKVSNHKYNTFRQRVRGYSVSTQLIIEIQQETKRKSCNELRVHEITVMKNEQNKKTDKIRYQSARFCVYSVLWSCNHYFISLT